MKKIILYFTIAALTSLNQTIKQPDTTWEWVRLISNVIVAGFIAIKALESQPAETPIKTEVVNSTANPVKTEEIK